MEINDNKWFNIWNQQIEHRQKVDKSVDWYVSK